MVYGWGSERFPTYKAFYEVIRVGHAYVDGPISVIACVIRKKHYIWFMVGDLNCF